jgi:dTDP-glucose pyrophosphorylase/CBS domain-containing protein
MIIDWKSSLVSSDITLENAIIILNKGLRILLVVDSNNVLEGVVNDGDVRRALIKKIPMESEIKGLMNKNPSTVTRPFSRESLIIQMRKDDLLHMPILNNKGEVCGLEYLHTLIKSPSYDNPVFLMAGGLGKRLYPLTEGTPKPLLSVGNQPILETILKQFIDAGFHNFYISVFFQPKKIKDYFGDGSNWGVNIKYVDEKTPLGTAGALGLLPDNLPDLPLIMMNGDILTKIDLEQLLHFHINSNSAATVCVRQFDYQIPYGVVEMKNDSITKFTEKPLKKFLVNAGIYVINKSLTNILDGKTAIDMPDFLYEKVGLEKLTAFPIHEYWLDIGHKSEFERANKDIHNI